MSESDLEKEKITLDPQISISKNHFQTEDNRQNQTNGYIDTNIDEKKENKFFNNFLAKEYNANEIITTSLNKNSQAKSKRRSPFGPSNNSNNKKSKFEEEEEEENEKNQSKSSISSNEKKPKPKKEEENFLINTNKIKENPPIKSIMKKDRPQKKKEESRSIISESSKSKSSQNKSLLSESQNPSETTIKQQQQQVEQNQNQNPNYLQIRKKNSELNQVSFDKLNLDALNSFRSNTILGMNFIKDDNNNFATTAKEKKKEEANNNQNNDNDSQFNFTSENRQKLKEKFRIAKKKITNNQDLFIKDIINAIEDDKLDCIIDLMLAPNNKEIYQRQLKQDHFLNMMLEKNKMKMLSMVLEDKDFYKFNELYPFEYITIELRNQRKENKKNEKVVSQFILNVVEKKLYKKELTMVLGWFIIFFKLSDKEFQHFVEVNNKIYEDLMVQYNNFEKSSSIKEYYLSNETINSIIKLCLDNKMEKLAIEIVCKKEKFEDNSTIIDTAIQKKCREFLRYIWEETISANEEQKNRSTKGVNQMNLFNNGNKVFMIKDLVKKICNFRQKNQADPDFINEIISTWKFLDLDDKLLDTLFNLKLYDEISILIYRYPNNSKWVFNSKDFKIIIEDKALNLILPCLKVQECRDVLKDKEIQSKIVQNYLREGHLLYYGAEMLNNIHRTYFHYSLSNELIENITYAIKKKVITNCFSPILTCLLLCEIISSISQISIHFSLKCSKVCDQLMEICKNIDESNPSEKYIKFLLGQKDSKGRTAYEIAATTAGCAILESQKLGTIVNKMWQGRLRFDGFLDFSSLVKFIEAPKAKSTNPFEGFDEIDTKKTYFHQISIWKESCSLRFYQESLTTILLIVLYNLYLFFLVNNDEIMKNVDELPNGERIMLIAYIIWCCSIVFNIPLQIIYCKLSSRRKFSVDFWNLIEIALAFSSFLILIDTQKLFPTYDEDGNVIPSNGKSDLAFITKATILSVNDIFVWLRVTGILLTYKELGPLIRMIYLLSIVTGKYLVIYLIILIACATVYTTIFYKASVMYETYSITFTTLFQGYLNNSKYQRFYYYKYFGATLCIFFVVFGGLILVNMLIALLSNEYTKLTKFVDASHRSVLIRYYRRNKWDKNFGYIILLATPINIINFLIIPLNLVFYRKAKTQKNELKSEDNRYKSNSNLNQKAKNDGDVTPNDNQNDENYYDDITPKDDNNDNKEKKNDKESEEKNEKQEYFNSIVSSLFFIIFYFPIIFTLEALCSIFLIPFAYISGILCSINFSSKNQKDKGDYPKQIGIIFLWLVCGLPFVIYRYVKDLYNLIATLFITFDDETENSEKRRIKDFINIEDIKNFIQFLHRADTENQNDLHTLFRKFLLFENQQQLEKNKEYKMEKDYLLKVGNTVVKKTRNLNYSIICLKNHIIFKDCDNLLTSRVCKRNLIIIEILENFLIDDENFIVDVEKMKMILPKTTNINNDYIKRLIYTNISNIQRALNKKKNKQNTFIQNKLLNKIVGSVIRLNKVVDGEGDHDPLQNDEDKKNNKFDLEDNEDDFYSVFDNYLLEMSLELKQNINSMKNQIKEEANNKLKPRNSFNGKI